MFFLRFVATRFIQTDGHLTDGRGPRLTGLNVLAVLGSLWPWSYGSWIYNCLFNQCLSHLSCEFEPCSRRGVLDITLCDKVCQWLATGRWFSPGTPVSSANKTDRHNIAEILLKVALNTLTLTLLEVLHLTYQILFPVKCWHVTVYFDWCL